MMNKKRNGLLIAFEGGEGSGKTTVMRLIIEKLTSMGVDIVQLREPGGSKIGEEIREVILKNGNEEMDDMTEALLFAAQRNQNVVEIIAPALKAGKLVIMDRYVASSLVYQGFARGIGMQRVAEMNYKFAGQDEYMPDHMLYFNVTPEIGLARVETRAGNNRLDAEELAFHQNIAKGYRILADEYNSMIEIDANRELEEVFQEAFIFVKMIVENWQNAKED